MLCALWGAPSWGALLGRPVGLVAGLWLVSVWCLGLCGALWLALGVLWGALWGSWLACVWCLSGVCLVSAAVWLALGVLWGALWGSWLTCAWCLCLLAAACVRGLCLGFACAVEGRPVQDLGPLEEDLYSVEEDLPPVEEDLPPME